MTVTKTPRAGKDAAGRYLPGNRFWEARSSHGRKPKFENADDLWDACIEYFDWNVSNPLYEDNLVTFQGNARHVPMAKMRAMTITGMCIFLDVTRKTWDEWRSERPDLSDVIARAEAVILTQKIEAVRRAM